MWDFVTWLPIIAAVVVCVCCVLLLASGRRFAFVFFFAGSAFIQLLVRALTTFGHLATWSSRTGIRSVSIISVVGVLLLICGWISLTRFVLYRSTSHQHATRSV